MKSLYITSVERYSGKTATCLALGKRFQAAGNKVGYLKPLSLQPWRVGDMIADEDAAFVKEILGLQAQPWELSPVVVTSEFLRDHLSGTEQGNLLDQVRAAYESAAAGLDILLLEGGASLREGYAVDLPTPEVAKALESDILVVVKYRDDVRLLDDALTAHFRLAEALTGIIINRVPRKAITFVEKYAVPFLENQQIPVFGVLPEKRGLAALTVDEIITVLDAEVLTKDINGQKLVETLTVGAMTAEAALRVFRKQTNKAVITGGDRTDIQLAALETSTACLVLTGNLQPSPLIVKQAEGFGIPILLVRTNTMETVEAIESIFGKSRLGQSAKLKQFENMLAENVDFERLSKTLGLG
jgi:BioD-like phosphotransacetylase family protein